MENYNAPKDLGRNILPHYKSPLTGQPELLQGHGGALKTAGMVVQEPFSGSSNFQKTFSEPMNGFFITNDGDSALTFEIVGMTIEVKAGESFRECFEPFLDVKVNTAVPFRAWGLY